ncbi:LacI family DNA-binding transcriptional regulator [Sinanaerobacter chloroacetimidivorans]|uniref:LacI family DNA-binding transcriptional regulator n=1 Tax=Sinanaerobacter chloroacetimidivorans TaxID=2818044 RepID=A0A8J7VXZ4_9FIRM|nr:LacI family DNA-binding transcriptional regulator [Sinanaerobacter chloroacetimidivorans]MBR0597152.1 LacI family DNA-binding transcriptional regulator [Sinanaerobacter chloroacetimidivorans]
MNIKSVAKKAGVSVATVSRVLNHPDAVAPDTKEHILSVMESLDYTPNWFARGLKLNRTGVIALLIPDILDLGYMEIAKGVEDVAHQKKYNIMLCTTEEDRGKEKEQVENFLTRKVDGIILVSSFLKNSDLQQIKKQDVSVVLIGKNEDNTGANLVYTDYKAATSEAVKHMIEIGHRKIGMIYGTRPKLENMDKLEGFKKTLMEEGLNYRDSHIVEEENSIEGGYLAASKLLNQADRPEALFVSSDTMAIGAMEKIKQTGLRIPQDIAVVGFDNLKISGFMEPKLTTVAKPMYRMGLVAARLLFDLMEEDEQKEQEPQEILIQSKLKVRKSCGHQDRLKEIF